MMTIRRYTDGDLDGVNSLLHAERWDPLPKKLGGYGIVWEKGEDLVGFCWALTSPESEIAYIESFVVRADHRGYGSIFLIQRMLSDLVEMGKTRIIGCVPRGEKYSDTLARYYQQVGGMKVSLGYFFNGNAKTMFERVASFRRRAA